MIKCKNCQERKAIKYSKYSNGDFCSKECARGFSTKEKRQEINEKIREKLKGKNTALTINKKCEICGNPFNVPHWLKHQKNCSLSCNGKVKKPNNGGPRIGGGKSKVYEYVSLIAGSMKLNKDEIEVAKALDILNVKWKRNWIGFDYTDKDGNNRKYYPDFYVTEYDYYIEYKGWINETLKHKMNDALRKNMFNLLIIYSNDKRYKDLGLNLSQIKNDPKNILNEIGVYVKETTETPNLGAAGSIPVTPAK